MILVKTAGWLLASCNRLGYGQRVSLRIPSAVFLFFLGFLCENTLVFIFCGAGISSKNCTANGSYTKSSYIFWIFKSQHLYLSNLLVFDLGALELHQSFLALLHSMRAERPPATNQKHCVLDVSAFYCLRPCAIHQRFRSSGDLAKKVQNHII